ncbi:MAG TPA: hypothetical protein VF818_03480 [Ktedonobacterales bacterium]
MIEHLRHELGPMLPLTIKMAESADGALTLVGDGWTFNSVSAWRVIKGGLLDFGWSSENAPELVRGLVGLSIVSVASQSPLMRGDPAFELSDGQWLEIFSDHFLDPWVMHLPNIIFVGSPADTEESD